MDGEEQINETELEDMMPLDVRTKSHSMIGSKYRSYISLTGAANTENGFTRLSD